MTSRGRQVYKGLFLVAFCVSGFLPDQEFTKCPFLQGSLQGLRANVTHARLVLSSALLLLLSLTPDSPSTLPVRFGPASSCLPLFEAEGNWERRLSKLEQEEPCLSLHAKQFFPPAAAIC